MGEVQSTERAEKKFEVGKKGSGRRDGGRG